MKGSGVGNLFTYGSNIAGQFLSKFKTRHFEKAGALRGFRTLFVYLFQSSEKEMQIFSSKLCYHYLLVVV